MKKEEKMPENEEIRNEEVVQEVSTPKKKKFDKNSVLWCVMILVIIGVVAGALLGGINVVTYVDPDEAILTIISNNYNGATDITKDNSLAINGYANGTCESVFTYNVNGNKMACYYCIGKGAYDGEIEMLFFVTEAGIVDGVKVYANGETSSVGGKVLKGIDKIKGFDLTTLTNYGSATNSEAQSMNYYVSGATVTTKGVTNALRACAYAYNNKAEG